MDARTGFAAGGFVVGATVVAVACAATLSNSAALADVPGVSAGVGVVRLSPSTAGATPTPRASAPAVSAPEISAPAPTPSAEVVPAPEPWEVSAPADPGAADAGAGDGADDGVAPEAPAPAQPDDLSRTKQQIQDDAVSTGSWVRLRAWAIAQGWSAKRIEHWIGVLQARTPAGKGSIIESHRTKTPANAGTESGRDLSGVKKTRSPQPPRGD